MSICSVPQPIEGRVAIVTGGASGIGAAAVQELSELGAKVASVDLVKPPGASPAESYECDVTDREAVEATIAQISTSMGPPDIMVMCAGATGPAPLAEFPDELWRKIYSVNVDGTFYFVRSSDFSAILPPAISLARPSTSTVAA